MIVYATPSRIALVSIQCAPPFLRDESPRDDSQSIITNKLFSFLRWISQCAIHAMMYIYIENRCGFPHLTVVIPILLSIWRKGTKGEIFISSPILARNSIEFAEEGRGMEKGEGNNFTWKCIGKRIRAPRGEGAKWNAQPMLTYLHRGWPTCRERNWLVARNEALIRRLASSSAGLQARIKAR